ncbi:MULTISPECIES: flagellar biosynthetic protein FliQ [Marinobacter]|uniref:Flagellar biosynthetic protein FliQ n=1 Tax=Marinobacter xestospongiae TaxID=994319 RepID=A0ABU3VY09_9GAMM|nr:MULTISPECIES: flagellar biosynthetic protein FliQ [Marinobacter]MCG8517613.1 flagellar biosynthetic protein FliQ [Pseudomonadales bacterium]MCK7567336.1 flagellar biosynthetic protein FliQ [Marinobacter xestospongiae]MDV2078621.1 flagellar biosynthetic protein FliQ [Marinobacter xestospongiae]UDL05547.1 flagellar biosynthetic protein FliQ [Marinobacter sp. CA1]
MTAELAVSLIYEAVLTITLIVAVLIGPGMVVGLVVSVFQAATQINEQTLSFLPRLLATLGMIVFAGHWILERVLRLFEMIFTTIPGAIG